MRIPRTVFVTDEKRVWMRLRDHVVVFERDPAFNRFLTDPSGAVLHILRIWVACPGGEGPRVRHYVGSIRRCECGEWMSRGELLRLFRRATVTAGLLGESAGRFRSRLSEFLRTYFRE